MPQVGPITVGIIVGQDGVTVIGRDGEDAEPSIPIPGIPGINGANGLTGPQAAPIGGVPGEDGEDAVPIPGGQGPQGNTPSFLGCRVQRSGAQTISNATWTAILYNGTEAYDNGNWHDGAVNVSRFTVPASVTRISLYALIGFATTSTAGARYITFYKNGTQINSSFSVLGTATGGNGTQLQLYDELPCTTGDYFEVYVYQDRGGSLDINSSNASIKALH